MNLPNRLTVARLILCVVMAVCLEYYFAWRGTLAFVIMAIASFTDWLDGHLARKWKMETDFGRLLDPLADKVLITVAYVSFVSIGMAPSWMVIAIITREFLITGLRALAGARGFVMVAEKAGKHKTVSQITTAMIGLLVLALEDIKLFPTFSTAVHQWVFVPLLWITLVLTIYSGANYFYKNRALISKEPA